MDAEDEETRMACFFETGGGHRDLAILTGAQHSKDGGTAMTGLTTGFQLSDQQAEMLAELKRYLDQTFLRERECDTSSECSRDE